MRRPSKLVPNEETQAEGIELAKRGMARFRPRRSEIPVLSIKAQTVNYRELRRAERTRRKE